MTHVEEFDLIIAGGGIAGLTAAAGFGQAGFHVLIVDPVAPVTDRDAEGADLRTTAILQPGQAWLESIGVWHALQDFAMPLETMRIIDAGGEAPEPRVARDFNSQDISEAPFGWNLPNWLLRRQIAERLSALPTVTFKPGLRATGLFTRDSSATVRLSDGSQARCRLAVACDGRHSTMRKAAGISARTVRFGQKALAFAVTHPIPHENVSTEIHRTGGPFTLVPLPDSDGVPSSAVVWMEDGAKADHLAALDIDAFEAAMTERSTGVLGPLSLASRRSVWPIISQAADALIAERVALVAEAAHVVPPIGAQGLNMSLKDVSVLLDLAQANPNALGSQPMLAQYQRARIADMRTRVAGITALNKTSQAPQQALRDLRALGLRALHDVAPLRRALMQLGMGAGR